jgi:predicted dienelactone hydrolase
MGGLELILRSALLAVVVLAVPAARATGMCPTGSVTDTFDQPGPYGVGVRTLTLIDTTRSTPAHGNVAEQPQRTLVTEVWYPTAPGSSVPVRDAALAVGRRFPLVVHSPGYLDSRLGESYLGTLLASWGYVVASIDFPVTGAAAGHDQSLTDVQNQPGDVSFVIDNLLALSRSRGGWLTGGIDRGHIGVSGLSLGGMTTLLVTYHPTLRDRRVRASLALAPLACFFGPTFYATDRRPLLLMAGDQDLLVPFEANSGQAFALSRARRWLVSLIDGTHTAFTGFIAYPSTTSYDQLGCAAIADVATRGDPLVGLGGAADGVDASSTCLASSCAGPLPSNPPMQATRQHQLTQAVDVAFFEAALRHSRAARCFLDENLAPENPDLEVVSKPAGGR